MSLIITGASGQLGRRTAELLLEQVDPTSVVLVSRRPEELAALTARGAEVRHGDFEAPALLDAAFAGGARRSGSVASASRSTSMPSRRLFAPVSAPSPTRRFRTRRPTTPPPSSPTTARPRRT